MNWISVQPESASVPQIETVRGIEVKVFASPHNVPIAIKGNFDVDCDKFVILLKYLDEDRSGTIPESSDDGIIHVYKGASSGRVERIEVDVKKRDASSVELNILYRKPEAVIERVEQKLNQLRDAQESLAGRLNYRAVSEALEQSKGSFAAAVLA